MMAAFALLLMLQVSPVANDESRCPATALTANERTLEAANKATVLRFHDALNRQDWALMETMIGPDYRHFIPSEDGFRALDWANFKNGNAHARKAFPDWTNKVFQAVAEGDKVAVLVEGKGTHRASIAGEKATGRTVTLPIMIMHQLCGGKLIADWEMVNVNPLMARLTAP